MRLTTSILIMGFLAACAPSVPDSSPGIGFDNSEQAMRARELELTTGLATAPPLVLSDETTSATGQAPLQAPMRTAAIPTVVASPAPPVVAGSGSSADIAAETAAALAAASPGSAPANVAPVNSAAISDENDFRAVSARQTIESDAERIARNKAQYQQIQPTALPTRSGGGSQPNIVEFALNSSNPRGTKIYSRSGFNSASKAARNCAKYTSPDLAQSAFLSSGGPQKDRKGLDPDGDGYACTWDPAPFRKAAGN